MFQEYDPLNKKMLQILDKDGKVINSKYDPKLSDEKLVEAYKTMVYARTIDLKIVSFQRQGRMYTYPPNIGQEAIATAAGVQMTDDDWLVPSYRELAAYLCKGVTPKDIYLYWGGREEGSELLGAKNMLPISVPIGTQTLHAAGIGYAIKYQEKPGCVYVFIGDGGTSQGDFHEALNFAGVWKVPVIFVVQNNQYAISMPRHEQTGSESIAIKSVAYGIRGIQIDGNDFLACYKAFEESKKYIQEKSGPVLIEAVTYRMGAHTTADDPTKYRTKEEEQQWQDKDPMLRLQKYLQSRKLWNEAQEKQWIEEFDQEAERQFEEFENIEPYKLESVFQHMYSEMPQDLQKQQAQYKEFLAWKESSK